ncbi:MULTISPECIES: tyrosine-type recombinase/integrase [Vibrio]|uniref:tyrosine-type recombinase/integrase n=1 Tax=Vibrio TaxID=662 RepID=UPI001E5F8A5D|nr:site-specific integrase [Vibrio lentus]MCC4838015.1 site-specific integrase [Vibrio lentus]
MLFSSATSIDDNTFIPLFGCQNTIKAPLPCIGKVLITLSRRTGLSDVLVEYEECCNFLYTTIVASSHSGVAKTNSFKSYRSELNKFLNWSWFIKKKLITSMKKVDIIEFLAFCGNPPASLIASASHKWFTAEGQVNPKWRPFVTQSEVYVRKPAAIETQLAVLSSLYDHLIEEEYDCTNPAKQAKKKIKLQSGNQDHSNGLFSVDDIGRAFTVEQWDAIWEVTEMLAKQDPDRHERTRMVMLMLYWMYLRISEVSYRPGFAPFMGHFFRHPKNPDLWIFHIPNSKGGKKRSIGVPVPVLEGLKRYRIHRGLPALPTRDEMTPLFPRHVAANNGRSKGLVDEPIGIDAVYNIVKHVYATTADKLFDEGKFSDAEFVRSAVVHSLRHTGITHDLDVRGRRIEFVSRDAGHGSTQVTNIYISRDTLERFMDSVGKSSI